MRQPPRAPTLKEIAERAGVHVSTASRVLRQPEPVDGWSASALRVRETAAELGYQRNQWAASLRTRKTTTLGVVVPRLTDGVVAATFQGIEEAATAAGYSTLLSSPPDELDAQRRAIEFLVGRRVDGLLLSGLHLPGREFVESLPSSTPPILTLTRHADAGLPFVGADDYKGGQLAAQHLLSRGHTELAVVAGPAHATTARDRVRGFLDTCDAASVAVRDDRILASTFEVSSGVDAGNVLLGRPNRPTAIFAVSDMIAIGILGSASDFDLSLPEELAVIGYNDVPVAAQLPVPLTSVRSPAQQIGESAVEKLLDLLSGRDPGHTQLPVVLMERATT